MAIQIPDPGNGVPEDKTGDNEHVMWLKVKDNFSDQNNAASRLVGVSTGNVMQVEAFGLGRRGGITSGALIGKGDGIYSYSSNSVELPEAVRGYQPTCIKVSGNSSNRFSCLWMPLADSTKVFISQHAPGYRDELWITELCHNRNTTTDANGFIKAASPIVKVFANKVELNDDATAQDVTFAKNGVGDYTITTVSGLSTDGWYIELPKDINGNPKVAVILTETDGVISLKTYKRVFSMETFTFVPDLDEPMDVPDGRWIDLRLNEIAADEPTEPLE
ncbi:phage tail fiber protein [Psychrobacter pacificensis]|uniref:phage tail fiber protein n=1 Tax=Psychrobacter pacificensis TaxID=112002 RepID=UPI001CBD8BB5|nr:hypothetical protein [Psychrobacter pacificensis]MBZ1392301.1 hypothetical protein [Psychrobacter pacificensis]